MKLLFAIAALVLAQTPQPAPMPYTAIHQPEFVAASEATFLQDDDILLGVTSGNVAKAYPAADLAQHGAVSDTGAGRSHFGDLVRSLQYRRRLSRRGEGADAALPIRPHGWRERGAEGRGDRHQLAAGHW